MGWFKRVKIETLKDLLVHQVKDLYDAEHRLTESLPKMAKKARSRKLQAAFETHLTQTHEHIARLVRVFQILDDDPERETCDAIKGLISESDEIIDTQGDYDVIDAALIANAQRIEHYEIASYGTARAFANQLGLEGIPEILTQTLDEEGATDKILTSIAEGSVNPASARATACCEPAVAN